MKKFLRRNTQPKIKYHIHIAAPKEAGQAYPRCKLCQQAMKVVPPSRYDPRVAKLVKAVYVPQDSVIKKRS